MKCHEKLENLKVDINPNSDDGSLRILSGNSTYTNGTLDTYTITYDITKERVPFQVAKSFEIVGIYSYCGRTEYDLWVDRLVKVELLCNDKVVVGTWSKLKTTKRWTDSKKFEICIPLASNYCKWSVRITISINPAITIGYMLKYIPFVRDERWLLKITGGNTANVELLSDFLI